MIKFLKANKNAHGTTYIFLINGLEKHVPENALKKHPGCYEALPQTYKTQVSQNKQWLSDFTKIHD